MFDTSFYEDKVPEHLLKGLIAWGKKHHRVGDFLTAVLSNNLWDAVARADEESMKSLRFVVMFIHNELPSKCHGSKELVADWIKAMNEEKERESVKIYWPEGSAPYTSSGVELSNAETHIAANDSLKHDARVLLDAYHDAEASLPDGYEWGKES